MDEKVVKIAFGNVKLIQPQKFTHNVLIYEDATLKFSHIC